MTLRSFTFARLLIGAACLWASTAFADNLTGQASVIDGDALEIHGTRIRLWGVEPSQLSFGSHAPRSSQEPFHPLSTGSLPVRDEATLDVPHRRVVSEVPDSRSAVARGHTEPIGTSPKPDSAMTRSAGPSQRTRDEARRDRPARTKILSSLRQPVRNRRS